ncbi:acetate/propionate family kinase [Criblamydia sequanensis]|uniref:Acetate kinase n=1 Tax=Candidatus Criblamydia sequanensis CRIB-18 TaxID=1437425 RepID=A0A090D0S6_9BACT|nr:acetate/propionate family kinase [Criblamydia sequanensis]CDR33470.1 Acetate kinase [Criblamydia sequanensis CRIB-18]
MNGLLILNAGSSTLKAALFSVEGHKLSPIFRAKLQFNTKKASAIVNGRSFFFKSDNKKEQIKQFLLKLKEEVCHLDISLIGIGQRVVHGGLKFTKTIKISNAVIREVEALKKIAPLHNTPFLEEYEISKRVFKKIDQFACFDTSFHQTIPKSLKTYPIPLAWRKKGIERFGFHGISHKWCFEKAMELLKLNPKSIKAITCHIGSGVSFTAIKDGKSIFNTMGFTPLEGAMMGTRCGSIDPGILLYLLQSKSVSLKELDEGLNKNSGLLALYGHNDMEKLLQDMKKDHPRAAFAFDCFTLSALKEIGALASLLNGIDLICFTGGIGENVPLLREKIGMNLAYLDLQIDKKLNQQSQNRSIHKKNSPCKATVIYADEESAMAHEIILFFNYV